MKLISISGLDGSGKSTQIELLKKHFEAQGKKVSYFHGVQFSIANRRKSQNVERGTREGQNDTGKSVTEAGWLKITLRKIAFIIDTLRFSLLRAQLESQNVDFLLSDRFFYDSLINIAYLEHQNPSSLLAKIMPRSDIALYIQIEPSIIMERQRTPEQGIAYLQDKKKLYDSIANLWNFKIINGNNLAPNIFAEILLKTK